jgi:hydrogenase maturation protein HypF
MRLEAVARGGTALDVVVPLLEVGRRIEVDLVSAFLALVEMRKAGATIPDIAATAQVLLARGMADAAIRAATPRGISTVCLSGGVAVNDAIATAFRQRIEAAGLRAVTSEWAPCGDGGVSFGQAAFVGGGWHLEPA